MGDLGTAYVRIAPNMTGIQSKVARGFKGAAGPATKQLGDEVNRNSGPFQNALGKLGGFARGAGKAIAVGLTAGAVGIAALTSKAVLAGAELEQQLGGAEAVFGKYADGIKSAAQDAFKNAGLSQQEFLQGANKMGSLFQGAGFDVQTSMEMSSESMQRAADIASIMGISTTDALEAVTGMAKGNFTMMDNLGVAMNDTSLNAYALEKGLGKTTAQMSIQEKVGLANQLFLEKTTKYAGNYAKENETLSGSLNTTKKAFDNLLTGEGKVEDFIDSLVSTVEIAVPKIVELLPKVIEGISATLGALVPAFEAALPVLIPALISAATQLINGLVTAMPTVVQVLLTALPTLISAFVQLFIAILQALPEIVRIISQAMPTIIDAIVNGLTKPESLNAIIMGSVELLMAMIQAIPVIIDALVVAIPRIVKNILAVLTSRQFWVAMKNAGVSLITGFITGIGRMIGGVIRVVRDVLTAIKDTLSPSHLAEVGTDMIKGLWEGISNMGDWLKDKITSFVSDKIPGPVKKALGINSPSKLFAEFGRNVDEGFVKGIEDNSGKVENSVNNMANSAIAGMVAPGINPAIAFRPAGAGQPIGAASNTNQTVSIQTVVLGDESAAREFFRQLNQDTINIGMGLTPLQGA